MQHGHGGDLRKLAAQAGRPAGEVLDFSANINPLGPPEWLGAVINSNLEAVVHYPDPYASALVKALARRHGVSCEEIVAGSGATEILRLLPRALEVSRAVVPVPAYIDYADSARLAGLEVEAVVMAESAGFALDFGALASRLRGGEMVLLGQPNNPTGLLLDRDAFCRLAAEYPSTVFVVDEAFADFVEGYETLIHGRPANVVVLCSMTKIYAIPGLRLGYVVADPEVAARVRRLMPPWSVNVFAQAVGERALSEDEYVRRTKQFVSEQRERLARALAATSGLTVYPGRANFLLARIDRDDIDAPLLAERLLADAGIAIRVCDNYEGLDERFFRVAVRTREENERLADAVGRSMSIGVTQIREV